MFTIKCVTLVTYPPAQDLVDGSTFLQCALSHHLGPHLLHVEHEGVQGFLDDRFLGLLLPLGLDMWLPGGGAKETYTNLKQKLEILGYTHSLSYRGSLETIDSTVMYVC